MPPSPRQQLPDRRAVLAGGLAFAALAGMPARAEDTGFAIDWQGGPETPEVAESLAHQIALVRALRIRPEIAAFFASQPIMVDRAEGTATRAGPRGIFFERSAVPADNPVLLHELLHRYHLLRLPHGFANTAVLAFFAAVRDAGQFPARAYMFRNPEEFFAMTASVALHGRAARPPFTRETLAQKAPDLYAWIVREFGLET